MPHGKPAFCLIGFGEAGQAIAAGLRDEGVERIVAWDIVFPVGEGQAASRTRRSC
jgi:ketol-acid reductoisomerase